VLARTLAWSLPTAVAAVALAAGVYDQGGGTWWKWVIGGLLALSAVMLSLVWLRLQWLAPVWRVKAPASGPARVRLRKWTGTTAEATVDQVMPHASWLGQLLDVGWATVGGNELRRFPLPRLRGFLAAAKIPAGRLRWHGLRDLGPVLALLVLFATGIRALQSPAPLQAPFALKPPDEKVRVLEGSRAPVRLGIAPPVAGPLLVWGENSGGMYIEPVSVPPSAESVTVWVSPPAKARAGSEFFFTLLASSPATGSAGPIRSPTITASVVGVSEESFNLSAPPGQEIYRGGTLVLPVTVKRLSPFHGFVALRLADAKSKNPLPLPPAREHVYPHEDSVKLNLPIPIGTKAGRYSLYIEGVAHWHGREVRVPTEPVSVDVKEPFNLQLLEPTDSQPIPKTGGSLNLQFKLTRNAGFKGEVQLRAVVGDAILLNDRPAPPGDEAQWKESVKVSPPAQATALELRVTSRATVALDKFVEGPPLSRKLTVK
jgi:hypothetical protein